MPIQTRYSRIEISIMEGGHSLADYYNRELTSVIKESFRKSSNN